MAGSASCLTFYEVYVIMISGALPGELVRDAWAVCEKARGFWDWPKGRPNTARSRHHTKLAHVTLDHSHGPRTSITSTPRSCRFSSSINCRFAASWSLSLLYASCR